MRFLIQSFDDESAVWLQNALSIAAHLAGLNRAGGAMPLRPFDDRRNRDTEPGRHHPAAVAIQNRSDNPLAKIIRKRPCHQCCPPSS
jgi:hypothetical protein